MNIQDIARERAIALLKLWIEDSSFQIQASGSEMLGRALHLEAANDPFLSMGRRSTEDVLYVPPSGDPHLSASLWVASGYEHYRRAYVAFANEVYGSEGARKWRSTDLAGWDADHLLNRKSSPKDTTLIRLEAIPAEVNQRWGSLYERYASSSFFYANTNREGRKMRWTVASKLAGLMPPNGPDDAPAIRRIVDFWVARGFPRDQAEFGVTNDLNHIFGRPKGGILRNVSHWI